ncbi:type-4 ice-structuring protein-like [Echeneis naucrates]|uniref:Type-4 ice-structuring protein-like n=1 Tax=Echeneis naucrates TaxID=173247 RepID=A0A665U474_ECHNA|nr:type-4 ice-structuring protein-like [Echeneis naucrates]
MKFALIATVVLLALAQGSFAQNGGDFERLSQYFEELKSKMTQQLTDIMNQNLPGQAQTFLEERKSQLEPLATQFQDQLRSAASSMEEHVKPMAENVQAQIQPMVDNLKAQMEAFIQSLTENNQPISN